MAGVYDMVIARTPVNKQAAVAASFPRHVVQEDKLDWREHREGSRSNCALPSDEKRTGRLLFKWASRFLRNERLDRGKLVNAILENYNVSWPRACIIVNEWQKNHMIRIEKGRVVFSSPKPKRKNNGRC